MEEKKTLEQRALDVIDKLVSLENPNEDNKFLNQLYMIAHGCNRNKTCHHVHKNWVEGMVKLEKELKDA